MEESLDRRPKLFDEFKKSIESYGSTESDETDIKKGKDTKRKIFKSEMKKAFFNPNKLYQINFQKIYGIFNSNINIFEEWILYYNRICGLINNEKNKKKRKNLFQKKKNLFQFITLALTNGLVPDERRFINKIRQIFSANKEDSETISSFKQFGLQKTNSYTNIPNGDLKNSSEDNLNNSSFLEIFDNPINIDPLEMSRELIRQTNIMFRKIHSYEYIHYVLNKDKIPKKNYVKKIDELVEFFNRIALWIPSVILSEDEPNKRILFVDKFILIGGECLKGNNYHILMAIIAGLNHGSLRRLKELWGKRKTIAEFEKLQTTMSDTNNYGIYRKQLSKISDNVPCIPYLGIITRDITFLLENELYDIENSKFNSNVYNGLISKIGEIQKFKNSSYNIKPKQSLINYFDNLQLLSEENLWDYSYKIKPQQCSTSFVDYNQHPVIAPNTDPVRRKKSTRDNKQTRLTISSLRRSRKTFTKSNTFDNVDLDKKLEKVELKRTRSVDSIETDSISTNKKKQTIKIKNISGKSYKDWSIDDVSFWLSIIGFQQYKEIFVQEAINGEVLPTLTEDNLNDSLNVNKLGHRKMILIEIEKLHKGIVPYQHLLFD